MALTTTTSMNGTPVSYIDGMSRHRIYLTVEHKSTKPDSTGATGATEITWRLYYELSHAQASIWSNQTYNTKFTINGQTITCNWNLGGITYHGVCYIGLDGGTITIPRNLNNDESYNIKCQINSSYVLTSSSNISEKTNGSVGYFTIPAITLATNITGPTSFTINKNRISFNGETTTVFNWSGQKSGTNNAISMKLQRKWRKGNWEDYSPLSGNSKTLIWGGTANGNWKDFNEGEVIQFRIKSVGGTLGDIKYSSTIEVKINNVPTLNPIVKDNNYISSEINLTKKEFEFNANDLNEDELTYQYKQDDGDWVNTNSSFSLEFSDKKEHTIFFKVSDGYDSEEKEIGLVLSEPLIFSGQPTFSFVTPDTSNSKLTKLLTIVNANIKGGVAPYTYNWTLINGDEIFNKTESVFSQELSSKGAEIKYSLTVTDFFGVEETTGEISTGYFTPSIPQISYLEIFKDNTFKDINGFYNGFKYEYTIGEGGTFSSINKYEFFVYRKDGEENIELQAIHDEARKVFNFESEGTNEHFLKLKITDAFGQVAELESNTLNRLYHLNELFISTNSIGQNYEVYKPLSMKNDTYFISYPATFNDSAREQFFAPERDAGGKITKINNPFNLNISVQASYDSEEWELMNLFNEVELLSEGFKINLGSFDEQIFTNDINSKVPIIYAITFSNNFETLIINQNGTHYVDFREAPTINNNFIGWRLNSIEEGIENGIYYLSYNDTITIPIDEQIFDLNGNNDVVSHDLEAFSSNTKISGESSYKDGNLVWINKNREATFEDISFQVTVTDSTGYSVNSIIKCGNAKFHACRSTYPKIRANTTGGSKAITFVVEDYGDDKNYHNYSCYYKGQTLIDKSNLFNGTIYRDNEGYNLNNPINFEFDISDITNGDEPVPTVLYCTYVPLMNLASGIQYTDIPNLIWIWFGEAPTISPRKNRLGINIKAEEMNNDVLLQINMANETKHYIKLVGIADKSTGENPHQLIMDLYNGKISGFIISGGTWD